MYGPLGTVVAFMMWLFVTVYVVLLGAELNAELELQTVRDSTHGAPKPFGPAWRVCCGPCRRGLTALDVSWGASATSIGSSSLASVSVTMPDAFGDDAELLGGAAGEIDDPEMLGRHPVVHGHDDGPAGFPDP